MTSKRIEDLASGFWQCAGEEDPFPRTLEHTIRCSKPVDVVRMPGLCSQAIQRWLDRLRYRFPLPLMPRWLNGCLLIFRGMGFVFVEESLGTDDFRMILAHEFAHYLAEYDAPRDRARRRLGPALLSIFDRDRPPTPGEKLQAALAGVELGAHVHYMERLPDSTFSPAVSQVEQTANELALELVAPWRAVMAEMRSRGPLPAAGARGFWSCANASACRRTGRSRTRGISSLWPEGNEPSRSR